MVTLKEGDKAPAFSGKDQNGNTVSLSNLKGKRVILFFYPKDMTPGCTAEACNLGENYSELQKRGFEVIGVSADSEVRHQKFIEKYNLPYTLLADTELEIIKAYGVWGWKKFMGKEYDGIHRTTFIIGKDGVLEKVILKVNTKDHTAQILAELSK
ncbi:MAG: thioredoxin-dependent thiol peroxidase [Flavobacteriales bacterium]|nr:thioredoxin-dependent thiol peroxidase [Flavobacteriales bacterium]